MYRATARQPGGYAVITDSELRGGQQESDTLSCGHCGAIVAVPPPGGCYQCESTLCEGCVRVEVCLPFEAWLDAHEGKQLRGRWAESFKEFTTKRIGR